ncbi:MAG: hypothetical protein RR661_06570, partial [Anaerovoracaceae bacterium]
MESTISDTRDNNWRPITGFPGYEINNKGDVRNSRGRLLKPSGGNRYGLSRDRKTYSIHLARLQYSILHKVDPTTIKGIVIIDTNGTLTPMTREEYGRTMFEKTKRTSYNKDETVEYYKKSIVFAQLMIEYYNTLDITDIANELSKHENRVKSYIYRNKYVMNKDIINEVWEAAYFNTLSNIANGSVLIADPF